jgi:hypothetical protein
MNPLKPYQEKKAAGEKKILIGGPIIIAGILLLIGVGATSDVWVGMSVLLILAGAMFIIIGYSSYYKAVKTFKSEYLTTIIGEWIEDGTYRPDQGLSASAVYGCEFLPVADRYHSEDYVSGKIEGVPFQMADVKLEERRVRHTKNGTQTYYVAYFVGQYYILDFNKNFEGAVQVLESERPRSKRKFKKISLESVDFNKKFKTFATADHTAFYLLTPQMMTRMLDLEKAHPGKLGFSFIDNKMFMAIHNNHSILEVKMFRKLDETLVDSFKNDFRLLDDLVKELKLNKKIYKEI